MKSRYPLLLLTLFALLETGCLKENFSENDPSFSIDAPSLDMLSGSEITEQTIEDSAYPEYVYKNIMIKSNMSWKAKVNPDVPGADISWLELSEEKHLNLSNATQSSSLQISAGRNKTNSAREAILVFIKPDGGSTEYKITQKAMVPDSRNPIVYAANGKLKDIDHIRGNGADTCYIRVIYNTSWKASVIRKETTANATLLQTSGKDDSIITLKFKAITTEDNEKKAAIAISPAGCEPDTIRFTQIKKQ